MEQGLHSAAVYESEKHSKYYNHLKKNHEKKQERHKKIQEKMEKQGFSIDKPKCRG